MYTNIPSFFGFPSHLGHHRALNRVCYTVGSQQLSILYAVVYMTEKAMAPHSSTLLLCLENPMDGGAW